MALDFMKMATTVINRQSSARHRRRAKEKSAKESKLSLPKMKKIIRRNRQRRKK